MCKYVAFSKFISVNFVAGVVTNSVGHRDIWYMFSTLMWNEGSTAFLSSSNLVRPRILRESRSFPLFACLCRSSQLSAPESTPQSLNYMHTPSGLSFCNASLVTIPLFALIPHWRCNDRESRSPWMNLHAGVVRLRDWLSRAIPRVYRCPISGLGEQHFPRYNTLFVLIDIEIALSQMLRGKVMRNTCRPTPVFEIPREGLEVKTQSV